MAEAEAEVSEDIVEETAVLTAPKKKHEDAEAQNLEKLTDRVEEAETSEELGKVMSNKIKASGFTLHLHCGE